MKHERLLPSTPFSILRSNGSHVHTSIPKHRMNVATNNFTRPPQLP